MLTEHIFKARARHGESAGVNEQFWDTRSLIAHSQPGTKVRGNLLPQRQSPLPSPFSRDTQTGTGVQRQGCQRECNQLRNSQGCGKTEVHHRSVTKSAAGFKVWGIQQFFDFLATKMIDKGNVSFLGWNSLDLTALCVPGMGMILWGASPLYIIWEDVILTPLKVLADGKVRKGDRPAERSPSANL